MLTRDQYKEIFTQTLVTVFGLPADTVNTFVDTLESDSSLELVKQQIDAMPTETFEHLTGLIDNGAQNDSVDNIELGDPDTEQMSNFYQDHVDYKDDTETVPSGEESAKEFEEAERNVTGLMARLRGSCHCGPTESKLMAHAELMVEMNIADAEAIISADTDNKMDPMVKQRINRLALSGNKAGADALRRREMRKMQMANKQPKTPIDNMIASKKRELAMAVQRKLRMSGDTNGQPV